MPLGIAYLHGLQSSPQAHKAIALATFLRRYGLTLEVPDLRVPSFATLSPYAALAELNAMAARHDAAADGTPQPWVVIGSSLGGYLAAWWAQAQPERVRAAVLLCPAFDLCDLWSRALGAEGLSAWQRDGSLALPDANGQSVAFHSEFYTHCQSLPSFPAPLCPIRIVHGRNDTTVPLASSHAFMRERSATTLLEVDDDHALAASIPQVAYEVLVTLRDHGELASLRDPQALAWPTADEALHTAHWDFFGPTAQPTAAHFLKHLDEFMAARGLPRAIANLDSRAPGHSEVWMLVPEHLRPMIVSALRPRRLDEALTTSSQRLV